MSSHPCDTRKVAFQVRWLLKGGSFVTKCHFGKCPKWPPIGGWLLIAGSTVLDAHVIFVMFF